MKRFIFSTLVILFLITYNSKAQKALDFNVVDIEGKNHSLYGDYLNKGKVIVIFLMVTDFQPCHVIASRLQKMYEQFGGGKDNVEFLYLSISPQDSIEALKSFQELHQITSPIIGPQGGSLTSTIQFTNGRYGPYQYVPQMNIIFPNGEVAYNIVASRLEERISDALTARNSIPNKINIDYSIPYSVTQTAPLNSSFFLRSFQDLNYNRNITEITKGASSFDYPSALFPEVDEPYIAFESSETTPRGLINISDVIALRKQVLRIEDLSPDALIAADINNDGRVTLSDIVDMQRFILGIDREWKDRPALIMYPSTIPFEIKGSAQTLKLNSKLIWVGNVID